MDAVSSAAMSYLSATLLSVLCVLQIMLKLLWMLFLLSRPQWG